MTLIGFLLGWNIFYAIRILIISCRIIRMEWNPKNLRECLRECLPGVLGFVMILVDAAGVAFALRLAFKNFCS